MTTTLSLATVTAISFGFILGRAVGGIISEYAKRLWFGIVEPRIAKIWERYFKRRNTPTTLHIPLDVSSEMDEIRRETEAANAIATRALIERDFWQAEAMRLRVTKGRIDTTTSNRNSI